MNKKSTGFVELIHKQTLSAKDYQQLWDIICEHGDGLDVESTREEFEISNEFTDKKKTIKRLRYVTKSKIGSLKFDPKLFHFQYIMGLVGEANEAMHMGTNNHLIAEILPDYVNYDKLIDEYKIKGNIKTYIEKAAKEAFSDMIANGIQKDDLSFEKALEYVSDVEKDKYTLAIECLSQIYQNNMLSLSKKFNVQESLEYLLPIFREVIIYDNDNWCNGVVDGIYKDPRFKNASIPVDYKFGKPKESYYIPSVAFELIFYKFLMESKTAIYKNEFDEKSKKWHPLYSSRGEMWYVLDLQNGILKVNFENKYIKDYHTQVHDYWNALDTMDFNFKEYYGYNKKRMKDFCDPLGKYSIKNGVCDYRKICAKTNSYQLIKMIDEAK